MSNFKQLALASPRLAVVAGPLEGKVLELGPEESFSIGRHSSNSLQLRDEAVSRRHCILRRAEEDIRLSDLGSLAGTFINGVPVRERRLEHGDFIKVGVSLFLFLIQPTESDEKGADALPDEGSYTVKSTVELPVVAGLFLQPERVLASHLSVLLRISTEVQSLSDVASLARRLAELALEVVPAERIAVLLAEGDGLVLFHTAARPGVDQAPRLSRTLNRRVLSERVAVMSNDVGRDEALPSSDSIQASDVHCLLCVPLIARDQALGVLHAETSEQDARFDRDHLELFGAVAGIASAALDNVRRWEWTQAENRRFRKAKIEHDMVAESAVMERVLTLVARVAPTDLTVLVQGESGTGKELVAKAVHRNSPRAEKPFVAINCATLSETLLESELFGHEKGAFTGAVEQRLGQFELAQEGTLFLDEVGEIPVQLQARLLRALETREIRRLGGSRTIAVDVRVVAATNRDLQAEISQGNFRDDLYHRLNVFSLDLPPLRDRREDIPLLASHFAARSAARLKRPVRGLSQEARKALVAYDWPGNVRELKNAIERAVVLAVAELLLPEDLPEAVLECAAGRGAPETGAPDTYHEAVAEAKRRILLNAVRIAGGDYVEAARRLGLNRTYLHRLLSRLDLRGEIEP